MSTIASPRESSVPSTRQRVPLISTPTSSSRPSFENIRSQDNSPSRGPSISAPPKRNRAALREYYNLKTASSAAQPADDASEASSIHDFPSSPTSELDRDGFNADEYVKRVLEEQSLTGLLGTYNRVLGDIRALDAERKALVYDNYSKLIVATETIGRMKGAMGKGEVGEGLDRRVDEVWERAGKLRGTLGEVDSREVEKRRRREVVKGVLETPERVRALVQEGKEDEARGLWKAVRKVLDRWKEKEQGGDDVVDCIEDGEAALGGEAAGEKSWEKLSKERYANL